MEIKELDFSLSESLSQFYAENFFDNPLYKDKFKFKKKDLQIIFKLFLELLKFSGGSAENRIFGILNNCEIISAAVFLSPNWNIGILKTLNIQIKLISKLGIRKGLPLVLSMYRTATLELNNAWHLLLLATNRNHRRKGYATKVLNHFTKTFLGKNGYDIVYLKVLKNSYAKNLYENLGFEIYEAHEVPVTDEFYYMYYTAS